MGWGLEIWTCLWVFAVVLIFGFVDGKKNWKVAHGEDFRWHSLISLMFYLLLDFKLLLSYNAAVLVSLYGLKFCRYKLQHNLKWKALLLASVSLLLLWLRFENQRMWDLGKGGTGWRGDDWEELSFVNFVKLGKLGPSLPSSTSLMVFEISTRLHTVYLCWLVKSYDLTSQLASLTTGL